MIAGVGRGLTYFSALSSAFELGYAVALFACVILFLILHPILKLNMKWNDVSYGAGRDRQLCLFLLEAYLRPVAEDDRRARMAMKTYLQKLAVGDPKISGLMADDTQISDAFRPPQRTWGRLFSGRSRVGDISIRE